MLDPRSATGAPSGSSAAIVATSSIARPSSAPSLAPCPRWSKATAARPAPRHARAKSKWFSFCDPAPWRTTTPPARRLRGQEQRVGEAVALAGVGRRLGVDRAHHMTVCDAAWPPPSRSPRPRTRSAAVWRDDGRLEIGGCDALDLAREFGTPALHRRRGRPPRARRAFVRPRSPPARPTSRSSSPPRRSRAPRSCGCWPRRGWRATSPAGGELHMALKAGFDPGRIHLHGNAKSWRELRGGPRRRRRPRRDRQRREIERLEEIVAPGERQRRAAARRARRQPRHAPVDLDRRAEHEVRLQPRRGGARDRARRRPPTSSTSRACTSTSARRSSTSRRSARRSRRSPTSATSGMFNLGGGLGVAYTESDHPPTHRGLRRRQGRRRRADRPGPGKRILDEPGRALVANSTVTLYTVESVKRNVSTYVAVDGGMSDNLRPMLYGARYEAQVVDRFGRRHPLPPRRQALRVGRRHRPRRRARRPARRATSSSRPATGAYGFSMANTYNGAPRAPVVFVSDGDARVVVRRETYEDLIARDV